MGGGEEREGGDVFLEGLGFDKRGELGDYVVPWFVVGVWEVEEGSGLRDEAIFGRDVVVRGIGDGD